MKAKLWFIAAGWSCLSMLLTQCKRAEESELLAWPPVQYGGDPDVRPLHNTPHYADHREFAHALVAAVYSQEAYSETIDVERVRASLGATGINADDWLPEASPSGAAGSVAIGAWNRIGNGFGHVVFARNCHTIVAIRGSLEWYQTPGTFDWGANVLGGVSNLSTAPAQLAGGGETNPFFANRANGLATAVRSAMVARGGCHMHKVIFTGHSLGGAEAALTGMKVREQGWGAGAGPEIGRDLRRFIGLCSAKWGDSALIIRAEERRYFGKRNMKNYYHPQDLVPTLGVLGRMTYNEVDTVSQSNQWNGALFNALVPNGISADGLGGAHSLENMIVRLRGRLAQIHNHNAAVDQLDVNLLPYEGMHEIRPEAWQSTANDNGWLRVWWVGNAPGETVPTIQLTQDHSRRICVRIISSRPSLSHAPWSCADRGEAADHEHRMFLSRMAEAYNEANAAGTPCIFFVGDCFGRPGTRKAVEAMLWLYKASCEINGNCGNWGLRDFGIDELKNDWGGGYSAMRHD